jgi:hypothetical protein
MSLDLIRKLSSERDSIGEFVSPYTGGDNVFLRIQNILYKLNLPKSDNYGWTVYKKNGSTAEKVRDASDFEVYDYCSVLQKHEFIVIKKLSHFMWLAFPKNSDAFGKRFRVEPTVIYFAKDVEPFSEVVCCFAGGWFYFEESPTLQDVTDSLKIKLKETIDPESLQVKGLTPELRSVYEILFSEIEEADPTKRYIKKVDSVLSKFGCKLSTMKENYGGTWTVEWRDTKGERVYTTIRSGSLRVSSAGYCLDGEDRKFDLQAVIALKLDRYRVLGY